MSIKHIRWLQHLYKTTLIISVLFIVLLLCAIVDFYQMPPELGNTFTVIWLAGVIAAGLLTIVIRRLRCPVCHYIFVGKTEPTLFASSCRNCGRRSGDTG